MLIEYLGSKIRNVEGWVNKSSACTAVQPTVTTGPGPTSPQGWRAGRLHIASPNRPIREFARG